MRVVFFAAVALAPLVCTSAMADIVVSLGNTASGFTSGENPITSASIATAQFGQTMPFGAPCGSVLVACSTNWTFDYSIPSGQTVTGATLTLGIYNVDPVGMAGNSSPAGTYALVGGDNLTSLLNTAADGLNGGAGSTNKEYDVLAVTIPSSSFTLLDGGVATIDLALQGHGVGVLGPTADHGAALLFSTLDLQTMQTGQTETVPEPSMLSILLAGIGAIAIIRRGSRSRAES